MATEVTVGQTIVRASQSDDERSGIIFLDEKHVSQEALSQVQALCMHPSVKHARVMPDCHPSSGCCVGFTCHLTALVSPQLIGGDIGCGMSTHPIPQQFFEARSVEKQLIKLDRIVHRRVPMGNGHECVHPVPVVDIQQLQPFLDAASIELHHFIDSYVSVFDAPSARDILNGLFPWGRLEYNEQWLMQRLQALGVAPGLFFRSLGTLGGGNHFIEVDRLVGGNAPKGSSATKEGAPPLPTWLLTVHSGSRVLGQAIYRYWCKRRSKIAAAKRSSSHPTGNIINDDDDDAEPFEFDPSFVLPMEDSIAYCVDMILAQHIAVANRVAMLRAVLEEIVVPRGVDDMIDEALGQQQLEGLTDVPSPPPVVMFDPSQVLTSTHNYIDFEDLIVRKGAIRCHDNQRCLIALNMRDGIWIAVGRGNEEWNRSGPHGCGRVQGRREAGGGDSGKAKGSRRNDGGADKKQMKILADFAAEMQGVVSSTVTLSTVDERPSVFRPAEVVAAHMAPTARVVAHYRSALSAKG